MDDGDLLVLQLAEREFGPHLALLIVAAAGAEHIPQLAIGDLRIGRRGRDHQDAVVGVDFGGRNGHARIEGADDEFDPVADELVGDRHALLGVGGVVAFFDGDLLAENAALGVDVVDRLMHAVRQLRAEGSVGAGDWACHGERHLRLRGPAGQAAANTIAAPLRSTVLMPTSRRRSAEIPDT